MVSLNFTIVVELILFLIFLWVTNKVILKPALRLLDERDDAVTANHEQAETDTETAQQLEAQYSSEISTARREVSLRIEQVRRELNSQHNQKVSEQRKKGDAEVEAAHEEAMKQVEAQRAAYGPLVDDLVKVLDQQMHAEGHGL